MKCGAPLDEGKDAGERLLVVDQKVAGRGAHEDLDAGGAREPLQPGQVLDILTRGADEEGEVAIHAPAPALYLVRQSICAHGHRLGVRHLEHGGDATKHGRPAAGLEVFLVLEPRLAEMHLGIDDTWQDVQTGGLQRPACVLGREGADRNNSAVFHSDIGKPFA